MIIRNQDKKSITTDLNLEILEPYNKKSGSWDIVSNTSGTIAKYSTEEKAIKVLDMIEKQYASYSCRYGSDCSSYAVFQMPQDSEV